MPAEKYVCCGKGKCCFGILCLQPGSQQKQQTGEMKPVITPQDCKWPSATRSSEAKQQRKRKGRGTQHGTQRSSHSKQTTLKQTLQSSARSLGSRWQVAEMRARRSGIPVTVPRRKSGLLTKRKTNKASSASAERTASCLAAEVVDWRGRA